MEIDRDMGKRRHVRNLAVASILSLIIAQSSFASNLIRLSLPDFQLSAGALNLGFDIVLPSGQKLNLGAQSNLIIQEKKESVWRNIGKVDLNQSIDFLGNMKRMTISPQISLETEKIRVKGTLYHCPKKNVSGTKNYCVIQPIEGISRASKSGTSHIVSVIKGSMIH